jgi:hypothetical protein
LLMKFVPKKNLKPVGSTTLQQQKMPFVASAV